MWLFSKTGFVSVVHDRYCKKDEVVVRARIREDLTSFLEKTDLSESSVKILEIDDADYRFRVIIDQAQFALALARLAMEVDYDNFKNEACPWGKDKERMIAYHRCWEALREFNKDDTKIKRKYHCFKSK